MVTRVFIGGPMDGEEISVKPTYPREPLTLKIIRSPPKPIGLVESNAPRERVTVGSYDLIGCCAGRMLYRYEDIRG